MKRTGIILIAVGATLFLYAMLIFDTSVAVGSYGGYGGGRVVNIGLQQQQTMMAIAGAALFIGGIVLYGMSFSIAEKNKPETTNEAAPSSDAPIPQKTYTAAELAELGITTDGRSYLAIGKSFPTDHEAASYIRMEKLRSKLSQ